MTPRLRHGGCCATKPIWPKYPITIIKQMINFMEGKVGSTRTYIISTITRSKTKQRTTRSTNLVIYTPIYNDGECCKIRPRRTKPHILHVCAKINVFGGEVGVLLPKPPLPSPVETNNHHQNHLTPRWIKIITTKTKTNFREGEVGGNTIQTISIITITNTKQRITIITNSVVFNPRLSNGV